MLTQFVVQTVYNKLTAKLYVDAVRKEAEVTLVYDRLIRRTESVPFWHVDTPDKAEAYFRRDGSIYGNIIESCEVQYRERWGIGAPDVDHSTTHKVVPSVPARAE